MKIIFISFIISLSGIATYFVICYLLAVVILGQDTYNKINKKIQQPKLVIAVLEMKYRNLNHAIHSYT